MNTKILSLALIVWTLAMTSCSSEPVQESTDQVATMPPPLPAVPVTEVQSAADAAKAETKVVPAAQSSPAHKEPIKTEPTVAHTEPVKTEPTKAEPAPSAHHEVSGVDPDVALGWLKNGNVRFMKSSLRKDGQSKKDISRLAKGQKPHTIVLSCSDSRVPPELVFDQKLGEIFVVRTAGEALDSAAIASIEYAAEHLGARLILVMGHTSCGAVKATLGTAEGGDAGSPALNDLVSDIRPRIKDYMNKTPSEGLEKEVWANAKGVAKDLLERSEIIRNKVKAGDVKITSSVYHLDEGKVHFE